MDVDGRESVSLASLGEGYDQQTTFFGWYDDDDKRGELLLLFNLYLYTVMVEKSKYYCIYLWLFSLPPYTVPRDGHRSDAEEITPILIDLSAVF